MKKIIIAVLVFIACQCFAVWLLLGVDFSSTTDEVDMEIYEFEHEGHGFLIFEEEGRTIVRYVQINKINNFIPYYYNN